MHLWLIIIIVSLQNHVSSPFWRKWPSWVDASLNLNSSSSEPLYNTIAGTVLVKCYSYIFVLIQHFWGSSFNFALRNHITEKFTCTKNSKLAENCKKSRQSLIGCTNIIKVCVNIRVRIQGALCYIGHKLTKFLKLMKILNFRHWTNPSISYWWYSA